VLNAGNGELVYYVSALVVVHDAATEVQRFYTGHDSAVTCVALHPTQRVVASGQAGRAPKICIFNSATMETIRVCVVAVSLCLRCKGSYCQRQVIRKDLEHSVVGIGFSSDGRYLVSVCSDPHCTVAVWDWMGGEQMAIMRGSSERVRDCCFCRDDDRS
jgi:hypothetical protein